MGNSLPHPSPQCLPRPTPSDLPHFENLGITFPPTSSEPGVSAAIMCPVTLPEGYGLYITSDRGDIIHARLCDGMGRIVANISWMSKGAYDNRASMTFCDPELERLDLSADGVTFQDGYFERSDPQDHYHSLLRQYEKLFPYNRGCGERTRPEFVTMRGNIRAEYDRLIADEGITPDTPVPDMPSADYFADTNMLSGAVTALAMTSSSFCRKTKIPIIRRDPVVEEQE